MRKIKQSVPVDNKELRVQVVNMPNLQTTQGSNAIIGIDASGVYVLKANPGGFYQWICIRTSNDRNFSSQWKSVTESIHYFMEGKDAEVYIDTYKADGDIARMFKSIKEVE